MQSGATATANADEVDDASFHCPFTPLFFPRWQKLKGWHLFYISFIFSVACVALIYFFPLTLCVAAAPCLKDEREDLLSHDTWRGGRKHSRDEDETVGADVPVLNICTSTPAILQSVKMAEFLRLFFSVLRYFPDLLRCISCRCGWIWSGKLLVHRHQKHEHLSFLLLASPFSLSSHN